jgi:hypothetical protein
LSGYAGKRTKIFSAPEKGGGTAGTAGFFEQEKGRRKAGREMQTEKGKDFRLFPISNLLPFSCSIFVPFEGRSVRPPIKN